MGVTIFRPGRRVVIPSPGVQVWTPGVASAAFTGVLDGISNVVAAYSLRKLRSAYAGNAVRVRRSSDSTEQDIGFASDGEFDSSAFSSFVGGGSGFNRTWYDQSGNSRNMVQSTTANQPQVTTTGIIADGSNDNMSVNFGATFTQPTTIFLVINVNSMQADGFPTLYDGISFSFRHFAYIVDSTSKLNVGGNNNVDAGTFTKGALTIISSIYNTTNSRIYINGSPPVTTYDVGSHQLTGLTLLANAVTDDDTGATVSELIIINAAISTANHNTIGNNMATRYGLSWTTVT